jgi:dimethylaniline monooxygenase (N-oxide forming)
LPHLWSSETAKERDHWSQLRDEADKKVTTTFPLLANPPSYFRRKPATTPYRLYRHIAPLRKSEETPEDRSIVFIGQVSVGNYFPVVECQAMWATAYMDRKLLVPNREEQQRELALFTAWCRRRYLMKGDKGNNITFELIGYTDGLLSTLGLTSHQRGWFKHLFGPLVATDFAGLKNEYIEKYGKDLP